MAIDPSQMQKVERIAKGLELKGVGEISFIKLCEKGCEPGFLAEYLSALSLGTSIKRRDRKGNPRTLYLRPLDSYEDALGGFEKREFKPLQKEIIKLAGKIERLNQVELVKYLDKNKYKETIFELPLLLDYYANIFIPLLMKEVEFIGIRARPQYTEYMNVLLNHIEERTGKPNLKLICDVLCELGVDYTEQALKEWRKRNRTIDTHTP